MLSPNFLPERSRPLRSSSPTLTLPSDPPPRLITLLSRSRPRPATYPTATAALDPVGDMLPMGEFVPRLPRDPERSWSENDDVRVDDRPLLSDLESLECEYEPVVVEPLCEER